MIEIDRHPDADEIVNIRVAGERLKSDDGEIWFLPKGLIAPDMLVNELPEHATFELSELVENDTIMMDSIPIRITRMGADRLHLAFEDSGTRKYWDGQIGFKTYMEAKRAAVEERAAEGDDLRVIALCCARSSRSASVLAPRTARNASSVPGVAPVSSRECRSAASRLASRAVTTPPSKSE